MENNTALWYPRIGSNIVRGWQVKAANAEQARELIRTKMRTEKYESLLNLWTQDGNRVETLAGKGA
jgi:hypothetical protein